ncbi:putative 1-alkyl-2-acetylglycerophosphocholine esterase [Cladobotryum mycophilum]|uniref:1-alkyl-2-acetylglycerophosphocholine esterase n=1 Tax=Cladobotryum mycophilum TaxID=491253 RepID=A0ABR0SPI3_9HYPO
MLATRHLLLGLLATISLAQDIILPQGPGPYNVTIRTSQLDDFSRPEIFSAEPQHRRVMISVFSPVTEDVSACKSPYMPPDLAALLTAVYSGSPPPSNFTIDFSRFYLQACNADVTYGFPKSESSTCNQTSSFPLIIFGPGLTFTRFWYHVTSQFLASYGYIVVTVDHPYDALAVQFPDGSAAIFNETVQDTDEHLERDLFVRTADVSFVLDQLSTNKTLTQLIYPHNVRPRSTTNVGIWGHSFGGATAVTALLKDERFKAGINLDGTIFGPAPGVGFDHPLILWQSDNGPDAETDPTWTELWPRLPGFKRHLQMSDSQHRGLTDLKLLADLVGTSSPDFGTIDGLLELHTLAAYVSDFFGFALEGKDPGLVQGPSKEYPQVEFLS